MSESASDAAGVDDGQGGDTSGATPTADEFKPITSQQELNDVIKDRVARERSKFKDYNDIKAKAAKLDEIEQANLSELEKANGRITTAEADRDSAKQEALRLRKAVEHNLSLEDADLFLTGGDEETLEAQATRVSQLKAEQAKADDDRKKKNPTVPKEGTTTKAGTTTEEEDREFARNFFGGSS
jgi:hypothetical protein